jgi:carboxylesterase
MTPPPPSTPIHPAAQDFFLPGGSVGILLVHGYGGSIGDYRDCGERFHQRGYSVRGVRLAGHGQGLAALQSAGIEDWQRSVQHGLRELRLHCSTVIVMGSSFGAVLGLDLVEYYPDAVQGLIVVNPALSYRGGGIFQGIALRIMRLWTPVYSKRGLSEAERTQGEAVGSSAGWPINGILATAAFARQHVIPQLPKIETPLLIMHSVDDPVVGTKQNDLLEARVNSRHKRTVVIPVPTHRPFRDPTATEFMVNEVHSFITSEIVKGK